MHPTLRCRSGPARPRRTRPAWRSAIAVLAVVAGAASAQDEADSTFRRWAAERVQVLRNSRNAYARAQAAEYLGGFAPRPSNIWAASRRARPDQGARVAWKTDARGGGPALVAASGPSPA